MAIKYTNHYNTKETDQTQPIPGSNQVQNSAGGYSFEVSPWDLLNRFLVLGSEGGTYYIGEKQLTTANADNVLKCIKEDGLRVVRTIVEISHAGRAPKNDPAIFALALATAFGDDKTKSAAYGAITGVCRIGTHLFTFCEYVNDLRGWSRGLRTGVAKFYTNSTTDKVAYQMVKYRQRNGWTHKDVLRLAHPKTSNDELNKLFSYAVGKGSADHALIQAFEKVQTLGNDPKAAEALIREFKLPREALPTELLNNVGVWDALLQDMPLTALVRNLGKMTSIGLLSGNTGDATKLVADKLTNQEYLKKSRVHPLAVLNALKTYSQGHGDKGSLTWSPLSKVTDSLDKAFYLSFGNVEPTNQNWMLALDVSGSMGGAQVSGMNLTAREASAAMSLITAATESNYEIFGFSSRFIPLNISPKQRLNDAIAAISNLPFEGTDCSLPMIYALEKNLKIDTFVVYTDSETWAGKIHPKQALDRYRQRTGIPAKLIVVGMEANQFTIADPKDRGMLDVVGFDTAAPAVMADFSKQG